MRVIMVVAVLLGTITGALAKDVVVQVYVDGKLQKYDPPAIMRGGTTYVPLRQGAASLGFKCEWLPKENAARLCDENGCRLIRKSECIVVGERMFLPLRKIAETFRAKVTWDAKKKAVMIQRPKPKAKFK